MKPFLYTCITRRQDSVPPLPFFNQYLDYVLFADTDVFDPAIDVAPWVVKPLKWRHPTDPIRTSQWHKHHPTVCFDGSVATCSIWVDANHWPATDISWFTDWFLQDKDIACFLHFSQMNIGEEAEDLIAYKLDHEATVRDQLVRYRAAGFTGEADSRLYDTTVVVRRHSPLIVALSDLWWGEIERGSWCDRLSFTYCLWKLKMKCETIVPGHAYHLVSPQHRKSNPYFNRRDHPSQKWAKL